MRRVLLWTAALTAAALKPAVTRRGWCTGAAAAITAFAPTDARADGVGIAAATSIGMAISMACTYKRSARWLDGKTPYVLFALLLIAGSGCYVVAEAIGASLHFLISTRIAMSLGFGAIYCTKRRAAVERDPRQREYLFLLLELASSSGMASGRASTKAISRMRKVTCSPKRQARSCSRI